MGHKVTRSLNPQPSASTHSNQVAKASRRGSGVHADSPSVAGRTVTPTSEHIIKETSVKRRKEFVESDEIVADTITAVARGKLEYEDLAEWFHQRLARPGER